MAGIDVILPWDSQPQEVVGVDWDGPTNSAITSLFPLGVDNRDIVSGARLTLGAGASVVVDQRGKSLRGSGSAAVGSVAVNLSAYNRASVSFWLYWDGYANDDDFAMEFTTNSNSASGFYVDPNYSGSGGQFAFQMGDGAGNRKTAYMARSLAPAATWNHLYITMDRNAAGNGMAVWVNGVAASLTSVNTDTLGGNFANDSLYLFSRANAALFGAGRMQNLVIRGGYLDGQADAAQEYRNPWQLFAPQTIWVPVSAGGPPPTFIPSWARRQTRTIGAGVI